MSLLLLLLVAGSIVWLRSLDMPMPETPRDASEAPDARGTDTARSTPEIAPGDTLESGPAAVQARTLLNRWQPREAAAVLDRVPPDASSPELETLRIECFTNRQVAREDDARSADRRGRLRAPADSSHFIALRNLFIERDYESALGHLETWARDPAVFPAQAHRLLALASAGAGNLSAVREHVAALLLLDADDAQALALLVELQILEGNIPQARDAAASLIRISGDVAFPHAIATAAALVAGAEDAALVHAQRAMSVDALDPFAVAARAGVWLASGAPDSARACYARLAAVDDPILRSIAQEGMAHAYFRAGRFDHGVNAMDEAIRSAMLAGAVRRGLALTTRLVAWMCELGQVNAAEGLIARWVSGFGDTPERLARSWVAAALGRADEVRRVLVRTNAQREWRTWARALELNVAELEALASVSAREYARARERLDEATPASMPRSRRAFLSGFVAFETGDAESARGDFAAARDGYVIGVFPFVSDPVLHVRSWFHEAESAMAVGDRQAAIEAYAAFLAEWEESDWELGAVARARAKLDALGSTD